MGRNICKFKLLAEYRAQVGQTTSSSGLPTRKRERKKGNTHYERFRIKLMDKDYESFNSVDLVFYFREVASEAGYRYSISDYKIEARCMKNLLENYSRTEICGMIDFVFNSEQEYMDRRRFSPSLLVSRWRNSIFPDSQDWLEGKYNAKPKTKRQLQLEKREWTPTGKPRSAAIGEWEI